MLTQTSVPVSPSQCAAAALERRKCVCESSKSKLDPLSDGRELEVVFFAFQGLPDSRQQPPHLLVITLTQSNRFVKTRSNFPVEQHLVTFEAFVKLSENIFATKKV